MTPCEAGVLAFRHKVPLMDNPFAKYSPAYREWVYGWESEQSTSASFLMASGNDRSSKTSQTSQEQE